MTRADAGDPAFRFEIDADTWLDGDQPGNPARRINHGCNPNCEVVLTGHAPDILEVRTLRDVARGEELTFDYGYRPLEALQAPCRCGRDGCAGYRVGRPWRAEFFRLKASLRRGRARKK